MNIRKLLKLLYVQVLIGLILGITVGHYWPEFGAALKPLGDGFVKLVKMMIAPVVFCTIVSGITSLGDSKEIGKTLLKAMGLFYALTILALITGLVTVFADAAGRRHAHRPEEPRRLRGDELRERRSTSTASPTSCCTSSRTPSSVRSPKARCCRCCCSPCSADSA